jgi:hypothetical protein
MKLDEFKKELDIMLKANEGKIYLSEGTDAEEFYATQLNPFFSKCIHIKSRTKVNGNYVEADILAAESTGLEYMK